MPFQADVPVAMSARPDDLSRLARSAATTTGSIMPTARFRDWFAERARTSSYRVKTAPLDRLDGWRIDPRTGNIGHASGRFFSVQGLEVATKHRETARWAQPIIVQPEIGILGLLVKELDGVLHCLMQAKMEPGNVNALQLSPTIQATRSNYTRVHRGNAIPYLEYFDVGRPSRTIVHTLQSEQGASFLHKRNRNMVVEVATDIPVLDGFCWLTLGQLNELMREDNLIHMDARSVMSVIPVTAPADLRDGFHAALARSLRDDTQTEELLSWFTEVKSRRGLARRLIPLDSVTGWRRTAGRITHDEGRYFAVIGVDVEASDREVPRWSQPLLAPTGRGVLALLTRRAGGVLQVLLQARTEAGTFDAVELAPTVQATPENYRGVAGRAEPPFLEYALTAPGERVRFDAVHSEEGGRFYHAENRYMIIEADPDFAGEVPADYTWTTVRAMDQLVRHGHYLNVEARCLLACLHALL